MYIQGFSFWYILFNIQDSVTKDIHLMQHYVLHALQGQMNLLQSLIMHIGIVETRFSIIHSTFCSMSAGIAWEISANLWNEAEKEVIMIYSHVYNASYIELKLPVAMIGQSH